MIRIKLFVPLLAYSMFITTGCGGGHDAGHGEGEHDGHEHHDDHGHDDHGHEHGDHDHSHGDHDHEAQAGDDAADQEVNPDVGISHDTWDLLMREYVADGVVNYKGIEADERYEQYLTLLKENHPDETWGDAQTMAYWINAYNAFTIQLILENYPIESIMKIDGGKAWDREFITIADKTYSLNGIEHGILRTDFSEPRIHFAVVCASFSCPPLRSQAFYADRLEAQLDEQARNFVRDTRRNLVGDKQPMISSLFDWYKDDFTKNGTVIEYLNQYAEQPIAADAELGYMEYNWSLNE